MSARSSTSVEPVPVEATLSAPRWKSLVKYPLYLIAFYVLLVLLLAIPFIQRSVLFFNFLSVPWFADFTVPEYYSLAPNRTLNFKLDTPDNESIGAWFLLSDPYYRSLHSIPTNPSEHVIPALQHSPAILYLHGNLATRAFSSRIRQIQALSSRLGANVLIIDYRGFGDSSGVPSEHGLVTDAKTAFNWLVSHGKRAEDILIIGHSLGTGVSGQLGAQFYDDGIECKGIVLLAPFSNIFRLLSNYNMFGFVPLTKPISLVPGVGAILQWALIDRFDTLQAVPKIKVPVLIAHAENDWDIPHSHSDILFQAFLDPILPPVQPPVDPLRNLKTFTEQRARREEALDDLVVTTHIPQFGHVEEFDDGKRKIVLVKTLAGGHDSVGIQEGVVDIIGKTFGYI